MAADDFNAATPKSVAAKTQIAAISQHLKADIAGVTELVGTLDDVSTVVSVLSAAVGTAAAIL